MARVPYAPVIMYVIKISGSIAPGAIIISTSTHLGENLANGAKVPNTFQVTYLKFHAPSGHLPSKNSNTHVLTPSQRAPSKTKLDPMPPLRPPIHLSRPTSLLFFHHPARHFQLPPPRLPSATRTFASTHPPDVSEHPSPDTASHESHYDPPSGWLFGVRPGEKYQNEGWESTWVYGYWGSLLFGIVLYAYKPDTS